MRNKAWLTPISTIGLILLLTVAFLAGCGGGESTEQATPTSGVSGQPTEQATPAATPEPTEPPSATVTPRSTQPTEEPSPTQRPATESGLSPDAQAYIDLYCDSSDDEAETWGEALDLLEEGMELYSRNRPPEELREYFEAILGLFELYREFMKGKDADERFDPDDPGEDYQAFIEGPEVRAAFASIQEVINKMDPYLVIAVNDAGC